MLLLLLFFFLGLYLRHMDVLRLGVRMELQLPAYATATAMPDPSHICDPHRSSQQPWILKPLSEARDRTCVLMDTSQIHFHWATMGTLFFFSFFSVDKKYLDFNKELCEKSSNTFVKRRRNLGKMLCFIKVFLAIWIYNGSWTSFILWAPGEFLKILTLRSILSIIYTVVVENHCPRGNPSWILVCLCFSLTLPSVKF